MKNRYLPFGYQIRDGELLIEPEEAEVVKEVFTRYANGETLKAIADDLAARKVEYLPGKYTWDKARVKRMLDHRVYLGEKDFPAIVSEELFRTVAQKKERTGPKPLEHDNAIKLIKPTAVCAECGHALPRRYDQRMAIPTVWRCTSCGLSRKIADGDLKHRVVVLLNRLVDDPSLAEPQGRETDTDSLEYLRSQQEIHRMMVAGEHSMDDYINVVLRCVAKTYESLTTSARHITDRLTATLHHAEPLSSFDEKLFLQTVNHILLCRSGEVSLELQNGKIISERKDHDERTNHTR